MPTLRLGIDSRRARRGANEFDRSAKRVSDSSRRATGNIDRLDNRMDRLGVTAGRVGALIATTFASIGAGIGIRGAISTIANFEETMSTLLAVSGASVETLGKLESTARGLGATTRFSATEAAEGLVFLARAGFSADAAIAAIPATLDLAAAGAVELGFAADTASNILGQFRLDASETERIVDVLVNTANSANTDIRQLAEAFKLAGPVANAAGLSLEETAAVIGVLGDAGVQASLAGTNLRGVIAALLGPTDKANAALKEIGVTLDDAKTIFQEGLAPIFEEFSRNSLDAAGSIDVFGRRNAAASTIIQAATDKLRDLSKANEEAGGTAQRTAQIMSDNLAGAFRSLNSAVEEGFLQLGERGLGRALRGLVDRATDVVRVLIGMDDQLNGSAEAARRTADNVLAFAGAIGVLLSFKLAGFFISATAALKAFTIALASNPIGLIAVAIASAVGVLIKFRNSMIEIQGESIRVGSLVGATFEVIQERGAVVFKAIRRIFEIFLEGVRQILVVLDNQFGGVFSTIANNWELILSGMVAVAVEVVNKIIGTFEFMGRLVVRIFQFIGRQIRDTFGALVELIKAFSEFEITSPIDSSRRILARQRAAFGVLGGDSASNFNTLLNDVGDDFEASLNRNFLGRAVEVGEKIAETTRTALKIALGPELFAELEEAVDLESALQDIFTRALDRTKAATEATGQGVMDLEGEVGDLTVTVKGGITGLEGLNKALDDAGDKTNRLKTETQELTAEEQKIKDVFDQVGESVANTFEDIVFGFESVQDVLRNLLTEINQILFDAFVKAPIRDLFSSLPGFLGLIGSARGNVFSGGNVVPFQNGGVVSTPSAFPLNNGQVGTIAEVAPEAILPLKRGQGGRLGVEVTGGGAGGKTVIVNMTVNARDADSFRQSERQIIGDIRRGLS